MDESALERYFDESIIHDSNFVLEEELELQGPRRVLSSTPSAQRPSQLAAKSGATGKSGDDLDLSFLPDELSGQNEPGFSSTGVLTCSQAVPPETKVPNHGTAGGGFDPVEDRPEAPEVSQDSGVSLDCSALASAAARQLQRTPVAELSTAALPFCVITPMTPMTPMTPVTEGSGIVPQLQNIVSTVTLGCPLDLKFIARQARNAEYNPKRFAAVIMRIREPRTTALIFSSGKMVCTGAKSEEESRLAARKYARVVQKLGFSARFLEFKIQNMVASCDVCFPIRLEGLVLTHQQFSSYEPELFPGLIYRMVKPRIVLLIFVSGKVVLTGAKERAEIYEAFENIYPILKGFRKQ